MTAAQTRWCSATRTSSSRSRGHFDGPGTYVDTAIDFGHNQFRDWTHGLGDIVTAVLEAGLELTMLVEHDSVP